MDFDRMIRSGKRMTLAGLAGLTLSCGALIYGPNFFPSDSSGNRYLLNAVAYTLIMLTGVAVSTGLYYRGSSLVQEGLRRKIDYLENEIENNRPVDINLRR